MLAVRALLVAAVSLLLGARQADACSCVRLPLADHALAAVTVIEGAVLEAGPVEQPESQVLRLPIDAVYKPRPGVEAGKDLAVRYLHCNTTEWTAAPEHASIWFLREWNGELTAHLCAGRAPATPAGREQTRAAVARAEAMAEGLAAIRDAPLLPGLVANALVLGAAAHSRLLDQLCVPPGAARSFDPGLARRLGFPVDLRDSSGAPDADQLGGDTAVAHLAFLGAEVTEDRVFRLLPPAPAATAEEETARRERETSRQAERARLVAALDRFVPGASARVAAVLDARASSGVAPLETELQEVCEAVVDAPGACRALSGRLALAGGTTTTCAPFDPDGEPR